MMGCDRWLRECTLLRVTGDWFVCFSAGYLPPHLSHAAALAQQQQQQAGFPPQTMYALPNPLHQMAQMHSNLNPAAAGHHPHPPHLSGHHPARPKQ